MDAHLREVLSQMPEKLNNLVKTQQPMQVHESFNYQYFCSFCLEQTTWVSKGSISECDRCHV